MCGKLSCYWSMFWKIKVFFFFAKDYYVLLKIYYDWYSSHENYVQNAKCFTLWKFVNVETIVRFFELTIVTRASAMALRNTVMHEYSITGMASRFSFWQRHQLSTLLQTQMFGFLIQVLKIVTVLIFLNKRDCFCIKNKISVEKAYSLSTGK